MTKLTPVADFRQKMGDPLAVNILLWDKGGQEVLLFFFFKQKTAYEIISRDWSSDVCSSDLKQPPKTLPRSPGNEREWLDACKGSKVKPGGNFEFSGMVTETLLLGNLAIRTGQRLEWDRTNLKVLNSEAAQKMVAPERRRGWEL